MERTIFESGLNRCSSGSGILTKKQRHANSDTLQHFPTYCFQIANAVRDSGLCAELITPDFMLTLAYPPGTGFKSHYDSRYNWGEAVVGVSVGEACVFAFEPQFKNAHKLAAAREACEAACAGEPRLAVHETTSGGFVVEIALPRNSVYVMTGSSRMDWKHGVRNTTPSRLGKLRGLGSLFAPSKAWKPDGVRVSITLRSTKIWSDLILEDMVSREEGGQCTRERLNAQRRYPAKIGGISITKEDLRKWRIKVENKRVNVLPFLAYAARFVDEEDCDLQGYYGKRGSSNSSSSSSGSGSGTGSVPLQPHEAEAGQHQESGC